MVIRLVKTMWKSAVDSNTAYLQDATTGDAIIEVEYENHPVKGELSIYKKGEGTCWL